MGKDMKIIKIDDSRHCTEDSCRNKATFEITVGSMQIRLCEICVEELIDKLLNCYNNDDNNQTI